MGRPLSLKLQRAKENMGKRIKDKTPDFLVLSRPDGKGRAFKISRELIEDEQINILLNKYDRCIESGAKDDF